jgi:hypothetical protein
MKMRLVLNIRDHIAVDRSSIIEYGNGARQSLNWFS